MQAHVRLDVFDRGSGQYMGRIVDLSREGFMLLGEMALPSDSLWECRIVADDELALPEVRLGADCLWTREGASAEHHWSGFHIIDLSPEDARALDVLLQHLL